MRKYSILFSFDTGFGRGRLTIVIPAGDKKEAYERAYEEIVLSDTFCDSRVDIEEVTEVDSVDESSLEL